MHCAWRRQALALTAGRSKPKRQRFLFRTGVGRMPLGRISAIQTDGVVALEKARVPTYSMFRSLGELSPPFRRE